MPFALDSNPSASEISDAINYILANFGAGNSVDPVTGRITAPGGVFVGYLYKYVAIKYADSADGSVNFSNSPTNHTYFGIRNSNNTSESNNPADYIWNQAAGGFGTTKSVWYISTGGRQIQFAVSTTAPDSGWLIDPGSSIDLDIVTSNTSPVIAEAFVTYFAPPTLQVPRSGSPLSPSFTGINPSLYATDKGAIIPFTDAQTDSSVSFTNGTWRIGNSSTTGYGDISYSNITISSPTDVGDYAKWPAPTAMSNSPAYITVPIRYKNSSGIVTQASIAVCQLLFSDPGATGPAGTSGSSVDISGYTSFVQNSGGAFTPTFATLSAIIQNIVSPSYSWTISGATPTSSTSSSVVVTPTSSSTAVNVTLSVSGSNLISPLTKTIQMPVVYNGTPGQAGANGVMSAFPTIYIWTGSSSVPTRPSTTSTYDWATGNYTAPSGWSTQAPSNTTAGNYLWSITVPLTVSATTTSSTLDWTNTAYPIRAIAFNGYNGTNGLNGTNGTNGINGTNGTNGLNGSATFVVTRYANDSSPPTYSEVYSLLTRGPTTGDICTVSYNNYNNSVVYQYIYSWSLFQTYITGSLIVQNTITSDKLSVGQLSAISANLGNITAGDVSIGSVPAISGTSMTGYGSHLYSSGQFALGTPSTNIVYPGGSSIYINGQIVNNGNIVNNSATQVQQYTITSSNNSWVYTTFTNTYNGQVTVTAGLFLSSAYLPFTLEYIRLTIESTSGTIYASDGINYPGASTGSYTQSYYFTASTYLPAGTYRFGVFANVTSTLNPSFPQHQWECLVFRSYK